MEKKKVLIEISVGDLRSLMKEVVREELRKLSLESSQAQKEELLKAKDVAILLKCSVQTIHNLKRRGIIKSYRKIGRALYFERTAIDEALRTVIHPKHLES